jgi:hypothetical protein
MSAFAAEIAQLTKAIGQAQADVASLDSFSTEVAGDEMTVFDDISECQGLADAVSAATQTGAAQVFAKTMEEVMGFSGLLAITGHFMEVQAAISCAKASAYATMGEGRIELAAIRRAQADAAEGTVEPWA